MIQFHHKIGRIFRYSAITGLLSNPAATLPAEALTLEQTLALLHDNNPSLASASAVRSGAEGAMVTARQYPNPEVEVGGGSATGLGYGANDGADEQLYVAQPLDLPFVREARRLVAEAGITSAEQALHSIWLIVSAKTRQAFYEILRRQAELGICQDNERILEQIRDKIALKVDVGESARYEVVKAETEVMNAVKLRTAATIQVEDAKSALRALFAGALPTSFDALGELPNPPKQLPSLENMQRNVLERQPLLRHAQAEVEKAKARIHLEKQMRYPQPTLKAGVEHDPGLNQWRLNLVMPLPIWNQRQGPISEAEAGLRQSLAFASQQELTIIRELQHAYNRYLIADRQVQLFEKGLLHQAEKALNVAEAAYRLGERGILDYLDAQRTYRNVRNDYINARFDRQNALIDLERLNAEEWQS